MRPQCSLLATQNIRRREFTSTNDLDLTRLLVTRVQRGDQSQFVSQPPLLPPTSLGQTLERDSNHFGQKTVGHEHHPSKFGYLDAERTRKE
jgi:hypothetical protein